jgi:hypothetical protein
VCLYPTFIATIAMGVLMHNWPEHGVTGTLVFLGVLFINMGVLAIDFPGVWTLLIFIGMALVIVSGFLVDYHVVHFLPWAISLGRNMQPLANEHFYFTMATGMGAIYAVVFVVTRFNYYRITASEIIHHHGFGKTDEFGAPGPTTQRDITDIFEFLLLGSGRLTIHLQRDPDIILENVPRIYRTSERISTLREATPVRIDDPFAHDHAARE